jgi:hypothetical protein
VQQAGDIAASGEPLLASELVRSHQPPGIEFLFVLTVTLSGLEQKVRNIRLGRAATSIATRNAAKGARPGRRGPADCEAIV